MVLRSTRRVGRAARGLGRTALVALLAGAPAVAAAPAAAQVAVSPAPRGWIGVSVELRTSVDENGATRSVAWVDEVQPGSPAARAGLRVGDVLVSIDGQPYEIGFTRVAERLRPGDTLRMVVDREGRRRTFDVVAGDRAPQVAEAPRWRIHVEVDSVAESMYRAMDSLRIQLIRGERGTLVRLTDRSDDHVLRARAPFEAGRVEEFEVRGPELRAPFAFYLFQGPGQDSLRTEMEALNQELRRLEALETQRLRELGERRAEAAERRSDPRLQELERRRRELADRSVELRRAMERVASDAARRAGAVAVLAEPPEAPESVTLRPLAPYVLGQNRAAGAEVVELRPEMADYFQVSRGVLVVDVLAGTPAARAGIQPGDVLVRVGGSPVASVPELRQALGSSWARMEVRLVRKGETRDVTLRR